VQSLVTAMALPVPWMRTMPASQPVALSSRVSAITWRSYCSHSQRLEAMSGQPTIFRTASFQSIGAGIWPGSRRGCRVGWTHGRSYSGASSNSGASGTSQTVSPWCFSTRRPVSVV
jgi:hypothetical protein